MPPSGEAGVVAYVIMDDVNARDAGEVVDVVMIIDDGIAELLGEEFLISESFSGTPDQLLVSFGIMGGVVLHGENRVGVTDHVQYDAILVLLAISYWLLAVGFSRIFRCPELGAETPGVGTFHSGVERGSSHIFDVKEDDIHRCIEGGIGYLEADLSSHFEQDTYAAGTIVGAGYVIHPIGVEGFLITPRPGVIMSTEEDVGPVGVLRYGEMRDDVTYLLLMTSVIGHVSHLERDVSAAGFELFREPEGTLGMCGTVGHTGSEVHLGLDVGVCGVGTESGTGDGLVVRRVLTASCKEQGKA